MTKIPDILYVYIAGPMRGYPSYNFPAFFAAQAALTDSSPFDGKYVIAFNPAANDISTHRLWNMTPEAAGQWLLDNPQNFSLRDALGDDTAWIAKYADVVCVLPGWEKSRGAQAEVALARALGLEVWEFDPSDESFDILEDARPMSDPNHVPEDQGVKTKYQDGFVTTEHDPERRDYVDWVTTTKTSAFNTATFTLPEGTVTITAPASEPEVRTASSTGGEKGVKLARYDLIPVLPLRLLAEHYGRGAAKYADNQWRRGYEFSKSIAAKVRHFEAWRGGEDFDVCPADGYGCRHTDQDGNPFTGVPSDNGPTCFNHTGSHHLAADLWHSMFLLEGTEHWPEHDDRFTYPKDSR